MQLLCSGRLAPGIVQTFVAVASTPQKQRTRVMIITSNMFEVVVVMLALTGPVSASDDRGPKVSCVLLSVSLSQLALSSLSLSL